MTSRSLFFKLMKENMKRRLWSVTLMVLAFFFSLPVALTLFLSEDRYYRGANYYEIGMDPVMKAQRVTELLGLSNFIIAFIVVIGAVICGLSSFSYLHSKKQVDFLHSVPVKREKLFAIHYMNGILIFIVPYVINLVLAVIIAMVNNAMPGNIVSTIAVAFFGNLIFYILMYTTAVLAVMLTGNMFVGILGTGVFYFYAVCIYTLKNWLFGHYFNSYYAIHNPSDRFIFRTSPFFAYMKFLESDGKGILWIGVIAVCLALMVLSLFLYKKRASEAAGKAMAFPKTKAAIKILLVIPISITCGLIFSNSGYGLLWTIFGLICGCVISHGTIEVLYNFDFKAILSKKRHLVFSGIVAALIIGSFQFDVFGYDTYIPKKEQINSMGIRVYELDNWVEYWDASVVDGIIRYNYGEGDAVLKRMELTDISESYELIRKAIDFTSQKNSETAEEEWEGDYERYTTVYVQYQLKGGKSVRRSYYVPLSAIYDEIDILYEKSEYKQGVFPVLTMEGSGVSSVTYEHYGQKYTLDLNQEETEALFKAYQKELTNLSFLDKQEQDIIGTIQFMDKNTASVIEFSKRNFQDRDDSNLYESKYYPVYANFDSTIALIEAQGTKVNKGIDVEDVLRVEVIDYSIYEKNDYVRKIYTSKEEIIEILNSSENQQYANYRGYYYMNSDYEVTVTMNQGTKNNYNFVIKEGKVPDFIKADFSKE